MQEGSVLCKMASSRYVCPVLPPPSFAFPLMLSAHLYNRLQDISPYSIERRPPKLQLLHAKHKGKSLCRLEKSGIATRFRCGQLSLGLLILIVLERLKGGFAHLKRWKRVFFFQSQRERLYLTDAERDREGAIGTIYGI